MINLFLTEPDKKYQRSFENYVLSYRESDEYYYSKYKKALENFDDYIIELHNHSLGIDIPEGWVTTSNFWLIDKNEVVGVLRLRHQEVGSAGHIGYDIAPNYRNKGYGTEILRLALEAASKIGIEEAIVTCNVENAASKRIIEKCNGKFMGIIYDEEDDETLYKYSITTL